ncbi:MAG: hypothetical protein Q7L07_06985 [Pseudohongiella sp.]|nr:hypothetical protein [Pseudohongiella sp.]MDP2283750.1 hypothetical protein [Pseudohongiella sp.]
MPIIVAGKLTIKPDSRDNFRNAGPDSDMFSLVEAFDVKEYEVNK